MNQATTAMLTSFFVQTNVKQIRHTPARGKWLHSAISQMAERQPLPAKPFSTPRKNTSTGCVNKVILLGRIEGQPQLLNFADEKQVLCFTLVTSEEFLNNEISTERQEFHLVKKPYSIMLNGAGELQPGQLVYVEGKIRTRIYFNEQHKKSYQIEIIAGRVTVLV